MNEDFIPFELAVKLKEKGYPQHIADDAYIVDNYDEDEYNIGDRLPIPLVPDYMDDVAAPTISQVLKWLRDTHKLYVCPCIVADYQDDFSPCVIYWSFTCDNIESGDSIYREYDRICENRFDSYEEAAMAGIKYTLDNLI